MSIWKPNNSNHKYLRPFLVISIPALTLAIVLYYYLLSLRYISTDDAYIKSGRVDISAEVTGKLAEIAVQNNQLLKKGDLLFTLDPIPFQINVDNAKAGLIVATHNIETMRRNFQQLELEAKNASERVAYTKLEHERIAKLLAAKDAPPSSYDKATLDYNTAVNDQVIADKKIESALIALNGDKDIKTELHPLYIEAKSKLDQAELDLQRTRVSAPVDGMVTNLYIQPGNAIIAHNPIFALVETNNVWTEANFKETEITNIKIGQSATITVDTYPDLELHGTVDSITPATGAEFAILPAQNSSGNWVKVVQRIMVKIRFTDYKGEPLLASGMSTEVEIDTKSN